jgi:hypothetical protein
MQRRYKIEAALQALIQMQRDRDFEVLGFQVAKTYFPDFIHTEFNHDAGEDGLCIQDEDATGRHWSLSCSLTGSLEKVRLDCTKLKKRNLTDVVLVFIAATQITQQAELKWRKNIEDEFGFSLLTVGREKIVSRLEEPRYNWISREYLLLKNDPDFCDGSSKEIEEDVLSFRNLPNQSYANLYGITETLNTVYSKLAADSGRWVVSLEGMGGIGKTTLAHAVTRKALSSGLFSMLAWESFRNEDIGLRGSSGLEALIASIAVQLDLLALSTLPLSSRILALQNELDQAAYLVVVDNLETNEDLDVVELFLNIARPTRSRLILTTRYSLPATGVAWVKQLNELCAEDALILLRGEAETRGIEEVAKHRDDDLIKIYDLVGGNPLALNLVLGLLKYLPIDHVSQKLAEDKGGDIDEFYRFVYQNSWILLGEDEKSILRAMVNLPLVGSTIERIEFVSSLPIYRLYASLQHLMDMSLVMRSDRLYSIHRLTRSFVLRNAG